MRTPNVDSGNIRLDRMFYIHAHNSSRYQGMMIAHPNSPTFRGEYVADYLGFFGFEELHPNLFDIDNHFFEVSTTDAKKAKDTILKLSVQRVGGHSISEISRQRIVHAYNRVAAMQGTPLLPMSAGQSEKTETNNAEDSGKSGLNLHIDVTVFTGINEHGEPFLYAGVPTDYGTPDYLLSLDSRVVIPEDMRSFASPLNNLEHVTGFIAAFDKLPILKVEGIEQTAYLARLGVGIVNMIPPLRA
jgi:hypothetical protein